MKTLFQGWDEPSTLVLLALLIGIALGTFSGGAYVSLNPAPFVVDNVLPE